ncbi:MAG TPA: DUF92 domain-containing protein [Thermoanaerobaculia bacterium]|jgi:uncharacterized protein (TIGR00297 family)|nr:DUF92 domain-containing protein [Thermoanaerobaculia bacterium]
MTTTAVTSSPRPASPLTRGELMRKLVHMAVGGIAFLLRFLGPLWSAACALGAVLFNLLLLPRLGGRRLWREGETARGASWGIILYPVAVLVLILVFHRRLEVAAAVWGVLAFGDGMASLVGMAVGRRKLPWNSKKSWAGSLAYVLFGTLGATGLLLWTAPGRYALAFALAAGFATALLGAAVESVPQALDDNISVPLLAGLLLFCILLTEGRWDAVIALGLLPRLAVGAAVNALLAALAYLIRGVDRSGAVSGWVLGTLIWGAVGWPGWLLLLAFFVIGTGCTKLGYRRKAAAKLAQEKGGRRSARHAIANGGVAAAAAVFAAATPYPQLFGLALAGALATAAGDTAGSEIGQLWGRRTFLVTTLRPVPRGTQGAISVEGTAAGIVASTLVAVLGAWGGLYPWLGAVAVVIAAFLGSLLESVVGATLERRGLLDNEAVNFTNTLIGALLAAAMYPLI